MSSAIADAPTARIVRRPERPERHRFIDRNAQTRHAQALRGDGSAPSMTALAYRAAAREVAQRIEALAQSIWEGVA